MNILRNRETELHFSAIGALASLRYRGREWLTPASDLFRIGLRNVNNDLVVVGSAGFRWRWTEQGSGAMLQFSDSPGFPGLMVKIEVVPAGNGFAFRSCFYGVEERFRLEWFEAPLLQLRKEQYSLFLSQFEGVIVDDPLHYPGFVEPDFPYYNFYPGATQMQFIAVLADNAGLYLGAHDPRSGTKAFEPKIDDGDIRLQTRCFCGGQRAEDAFDIVIAPFEGDWMDACDIYRDWIETTGALPPKGCFPKLVDQSPIVVVYPVCGTGDDKGDMEPNEYFPYVNALPAIRRLAGELDSKVMALLMHWEGTAPWAPPYVWPPLGGEAMLREYAEALHRDGNYLGVYCSGTAWTQRSSINGYSREKQFAEEGLERFMIRGPHGETRAFICNGPKGVAQRIGCDMCVSEPWTRETLRSEMRKIARFGLIDYAQSFDQNLGGASHPCWAETHHHPPLPGAWQTANMQSLQHELRLDNPNLVLGCESAAADCYLGNLPFNDLRYASWALAQARPVPAYAYLFHEYINNFMGNQCGMMQQLRFLDSPENLLWRIGYAFTCGNLLSVTLKDGGTPHWGWSVPWDYPEPEREPVVTLLRNLNALRRTYPEFLQFGRMVRPPVEMKCGSWSLATFGGNRVLDSVLQSSWIAPTGEMAMVLTNFLPEVQSVRLLPGTSGREETLCLEPLNAMVLRLPRRAIESDGKLVRQVESRV